MWYMGNRRKPAAVRRAMGNPGKRPIPDVVLPDTGPAVKPESVKKRRRASEIWDQYAPTLVILGTLKAESTHLFAAWCWLTAEFERRPIEFTASKVAQMRALASSLGMDPSSQAKLAVARLGEEEPEDEFFTGPRAVEG